MKIDDLPQWAGPGFCDAPAFYYVDNTDEYHKSALLSAHDCIKIITDNPAQWKYEKENRGEPSPAMVFGTRAHCITLEPEQFDNRYYCALERPFGIDGRTKAGKELLEEFKKKAAEHDNFNAGKEVVSPADMELLKAMGAAFEAYPLSKICRGQNFIPELGFIFNFPDSSVRCRGLLDGYDPDKNIIVEYKSINEATTKNINNTIKNFKYDVQAAMYIFAVQTLTGKTPTFVWIFQEKRAPHFCRAVKCSHDHFQNGFSVINRAVEIFAECIRNKSWPAYGDKVEELDLPYWAWHNEVSQWT